MKLQMRPLLVVFFLMFGGISAWAADPVKLSFGTDWLAEAEHGGFYQSQALGLYRRHGLDISIRMGGPQTNGSLAVAGGQVDFMLASGALSALSMAEQGIPVQAVAAYFQKDPQVLIAHPGTGADTMEELRGHPIMMSAGARATLWEFLKRRFGYEDAQYRPYNFALAPWVRDKTMVMEGFLSSEPYLIEKQTGERPVVQLIADHGFANYSDVILVRSRMIAEHPDWVQAFVDASAEGWYSYLYGDPSPGNALIRHDNPDMTQDVLDNAIAVMRAHGIVDSGESLTNGIGAMSDARWAALLDSMTEAGLFKPGLDARRAYTLRFVNRKVGMELRPR